MNHPPERKRGSYAYDGRRALPRMLSSRWLQAFLIVRALLAAIFHFTIKEEGESSELELQAIHCVMPQADRFSEKRGDPPFNEAYREEDGEL